MAPKKKTQACLPSKKKTTKKRGKVKKRSFAGRLFLWLSGLVLLLAVVLAGAFAYAWSSMALPPEVPLTETTVLLDSGGNRLASFNAGENRVHASLAEVPVVVRQAVVNTEDNGFYKHQGVDPRGVARALWSDLHGTGSLQGGSTITQQYVKTQYTNQQRTPSRKVREAILSMKLEQRYGKDEILERYLNAIYFGRGAYGVQAASHAYFGKDIAKVGLEEASYLAGLIRAPERADSYATPEVADARRNATLNNMVRFGSITSEQAAVVAAKSVKSYTVARTAAEPTTVSSDKGTQFFVDYVKTVLSSTYPEAMVEGGGLSVTTTLDLSMQAAAYDSVYGFLKPSEPAGALVSVDRDGRIKAMVGGRDYKASQVNLAVSRYAGQPYGGGTGRQAGSTFKAFALAAALEDGVSINKMYDAPSKITLEDQAGSPWNVSNFGNESFGRMTLLDATAHSVNTVYAQLAKEEGGQRIADVAKRAGITTPLPSNLALVLGSEPVSVLDMAGSYMTFGNRGEAVAPYPILEVRNAKGEVLEKTKPLRSEALKQDTADTVNQALQQVVSSGTGRAAAFGQPLAGKTGTTEENGDAWFVGYTPELSTAVWMGYPEGSQRQMKKVRGIDVTGGSFPAQMFSTYMRVVTKDSKGPTFAPPLKAVSTTTTAAETTSTAPETTTSTAAPTTTTSVTRRSGATTTSPVSTTTTTRVNGRSNERSSRSQRKTSPDTKKAGPADNGVPSG